LSLQANNFAPRTASSSDSGTGLRHVLRWDA
jgi:hypothetical protein